jgi:hypothetical protein
MYGLLVSRGYEEHRMSHDTPVLPRDLFNEANLLKCMGQPWIKLDEYAGHDATIPTKDVPVFDLDQDPNSGTIRPKFKDRG